jgi:DNA-directed RNA polymerase II subunit RPB1
MQKYNFTHERMHRTESVQFGTLSTKTIRDMAVVTVNNQNIYHRGTPTSGGVNDLLMGTIDRRVRCATCNGDMQTCQGHTGVIELGVPVYNIGFVETTLKVLRSVCYFCSRVLLSEDEIQAFLIENHLKKLSCQAMHTACRNRKRCPHCTAGQPSYNRSMCNVIRLEWTVDALSTLADDTERDQVTRRSFSSIEAGSILDNISDEDCRLLGFDVEFSHPRNMVQDVLLVIPPIARPAIMQSTGSRVRGQDDITCTYQNILKRAQDLQAHMGKMSWDVDKPIDEAMMDKLEKLQAEVFTIVNNSAKGSSTRVQRSGAAIKSLVCRLKGKEGRIRGNLNGKRVDYSARSVISPDPCMDVDEIGVPECVALTLTVPHPVTAVNVIQCQQMVRNGAGRLDGAQSLISKKDVVTQLEYCVNRNALAVEPGCIVERYLKDGDIVIFNRQPSLHKFSLMAHRVRIMRGNTFRLSLSCTSAYNADFDGDEMNLHAIQSPASAAEAVNLMSVPTNIISPQANKPIIAIVQDALLGSALMTHFDRLIDRAHFMRHICYIEKESAPGKCSLPMPSVLWPRAIWTGRQLFSALLPPTLSMQKGAVAPTPAWPEATDLLVDAGQLLYGTISKAVLGATAGGMVDIICRDIGPRAAMNFMSDVQRLVNPFLSEIGFSVKMSDCILGPAGDAEVEACIDIAKQNAKAIADSNIPANLRGEAEMMIQTIMSKLLMQTGAIAKKHMAYDNAIRTMVNVGSKGNDVNLSQITGTVGQQTVDGKRIFSESSDRTLSFYSRGTTLLASHGFVESNYQKGLTSEESFFHSMGGREGLVDTAVKTASSGYIQRRLVKMMEDHQVAYGTHPTVRDAQKHVIEFTYGNDGFDASKVERFWFHAMSWRASKIQDVMCDASPTVAQEAELGQMLNFLHAARRGRLSPLTPTFDNLVLTPFHPDRVLARFRGTDHVGNCDISSFEVVVAEELDRLTRVFMDSAQRNCLVCVLRFCFCSRTLARHLFDVDRAMRLFRAVEDQFHQSLITPGEMVGALAATSIGEPCTQMHASGIRTHAPETT